jgi:hypothetical protein
MHYRISREELLDRFRVWDGYLRRKVHLVACGGTALTLLGFKDSTKDIDLIVPDSRQYVYLTGILKDLGYRQVTVNGWRTEDVFVVDIFRGNFVHTTELLESSLDAGNHNPVQEFSSIRLSTLNDYDLVISKLFRGTGVDFEDCLSLIRGRAGALNLRRLSERFKETAFYSISEPKVKQNLDLFLQRVREELGYGT